MLNDQNERPGSPDESEYHFSDEDISYEVEPETPKSPPPPTGPKVSLLNRLTQSKRMVISVIIFVVLIFVVYKLIAPTGQTTTGTEISPATVAQQKAPRMTVQPIPAKPPEQAQNFQQPIQQQPANPYANQAMPQQTMPMAAQTMPVAPTVSSQNVTPNQPQAMPSQMQAQPANATVPQQQPVVSAQPLNNGAIPNASMPVQTSQATEAPATNVMPVESTNSYNLTPPVVGILSKQVPGGVDAKVAEMRQENQKLMAQMETEYTQKLNDFSEQNKSLQTQVQALSTRVAAMESELSRMIQVLTRQNAGVPPPPKIAAPVVPVAPLPVMEVHQRIPFSVQAIIPGRAWLKADNGETVTVAEGDLIKGLGRVTKIDPYDGVVEINTGGRVLSLSYGTGG